MGLIKIMRLHDDLPSIRPVFLDSVPKLVQLGVQTNSLCELAMCGFGAMGQQVAVAREG